MLPLNVRKFDLKSPLADDVVMELRAGDILTITGELYTARDAAHARLAELLERGESLPFDPIGQIIYYVGPTPPPPGRPIGAAGPTTSYRMDKYTPALLATGIKATIGKGPRSNEVVAAIRKYKAVYLAAVGGAGALLANRVLSCEVVAFKELGTEAVRKLEVKDLPVVVINDTEGNDLYEIGLARWRRAL